MQVIERGEIDRIWRIIFIVETGDRSESVKT
jgi:hypothetical protein